MAMDLNKFEYKPDEIYNRDAITYALRQLAPRWVPQVFKSGKIEREKGKRALRVGDISGRPANHRGSCRIWLDGEQAGSWTDFDNRHVLKGGPVSTIKEHFKLDDGQAYAKATELIHHYGGQHYIDEAPKQQTNGHAKGVSIVPTISQKIANQIAFYWSERQSAAGSLIENYWQARKLGKAPPAAFGSIDGDPDLVFSPMATNFDTGIGHPTMICRFRYPNGTLTGALHLTHLLPDGSWHIGRVAAWKRHSKKVWGPRINGGLIMLSPMGLAGELGIGEGIESTAAGMAYWPGVGGWAAGDTSGMIKFAEWLRSAEASQVQAIKRLLVWGDAGKGGEAAAKILAAAAHTAGIPAVELYFPGSGDDLAADLAAGLPPPPPILDIEPEEPTLPLEAVEPDPGLTPGDKPVWPGATAGPVTGPPTADDVQRRLMAIEKGVSGDVVLAACRELAAAQLDPISQESMINLLFRRSGIKKTTLIDAVKKIQTEILPPEQNHEGPGKYPWASKLARGNDGDPKGIMSNASVVIREADEIKGSFGFNEFTGMISVLKKLPWEYGYPNPCADRPWTDEDELAVMEWMQGTVGIHAPKGAIFDAVQRIAAENKYHPVREMLSSLQWDKVPRLETASVVYFGAPDTLYYREVFKRWMISAVARIYRPGVKADNMTVLEGDQGQGKSSAIRVLFDPWFTDQLAEMGTKDASLELRGIWCAEYSDLEGMGLAEARTIKRFMSQTTDRFRPPYGRVPIKVERQNVFAGTTNDQEYLKDATGGRRFWPLRCQFVDIDAIIRDKDQLWAEAVAMFVAKVKWWIKEQEEPELAAAASSMVEARYRTDAWEAIVKRWLDTNRRANATIDELLRSALEIGDSSKWSKNDQVRIAFIMRRLKWIRAVDRNPPREWRYWRPEAFNPDVAEEM